MKVSRKKAEENRELVLKTAGQLFRQKGFDGIGVADVMKESGLTVGGFYNNFTNKDDLIAQTCQVLANDVVSRWEKHISDPEIEDPYKRIGISYLSEKSRDNLNQACMFNTLAFDVPRHDPKLKSIFSEGASSLIEVLSKIIPSETEEEQRANAIGTLSQWIGAQVLARATSGTSLSDEILEIARKQTKLN